MTKNRCFFLLALVLFLAGMLIAFYRWNSAAVANVKRQTFAFAELGETEVIQGGEKGFVLMLVDGAHMQEARTLANTVAATGAVTVLVNLDLYFRNVAQEKAECLESVTLLDVFVQQVQQNLRFGRVIRPVLLGMGAGAAYVPLILQQARAGIFSEGISLAPPPTFLLPVSPCGSAARSVDWRSPAQPIQTPSPVSTPTAWHVFTDETEALLVLQQQTNSTDSGTAQTVDNLPLVELPARSGSSGPFLAIVLSGDGGWANIDKDIGEALVDQGIPTVGWNSLKYFWQKKTPDIMARDLDSVITHYRELWQKQQVLLIGFSLGADVLPFMVNRLSPENRQWIAGMVLLSPSKSADFQFQVTDWVDNSTGENDTPLAPEMDRLLALPVLCVYGVEDDDGLCPDLQGRPVSQVVRLPGDHHFDGDYETVTQLILQRFVQAAGKP